MLHQLERLGPRTDFLRDAVDLVLEHVAEALGENERKDKLLVFGRILRAADGTRGVPNPGFERFVRRFRHRREISESRCSWKDGVCARLDTSPSIPLPV